MFKQNKLLSQMRRLSKQTNHNKFLHPKICKNKAIDIIKKHAQSLHQLEYDKMKLIYIPILTNNSIQINTNYAVKYNNNFLNINNENLLTYKSDNNGMLKYTGPKLFDSETNLPDDLFEQISKENIDFDAQTHLNPDCFPEFGNIIIIKQKQNYNDIYHMIFKEINKMNENSIFESKITYFYDLDKTIITYIPLYSMKTGDQYDIINGLTGNYYCSRKKISYAEYIVGTALIFGIIGMMTFPIIIFG